MVDEITEEVTDENTETITDTDESGETEELEDSESSEEDVTDQTDDTPKKGGIEKKIGKLTGKLRTAEQEAAYWKGVAEGKAQASEVKKEPEPVVTKTTGLNPADFDTYEDYLDARDTKIRADLKAELLGEQQQKERVQTAKTIQNQYSIARKSHDDFDDVALNPRLPINQTIVDAAMGDNFADILYALGKNPEKAAQISLMPPLQAAREIGKIEERILNPKKPTKKTTTNAPEPIKTLGGGGNADATPDDKLSRKQKFAKWEKARLAQV